MSDNILALPLLVEPSELNQHLQDEGLLIIDICREDSPLIPGAIRIPPGALISGIKPAVGKLPDLERLNQLFSAIGYHTDRQIVAYDDEGGGWAGRFIWTLDVIGHEKSSLLNGGLIAWSDEGLPMTRENPEIQPTDVSLSINSDVIAEKEDVLRSLDDPDEIIWDARSREEHEGTRVVSARGGHIPGAINFDWLDAMDRDNNLRLLPDLQERLDEAGIVKTKSVITHCQTHHRSGLTYFIGKYLGYRIRAYHGSWSEWGNDPDTPIDP